MWGRQDDVTGSTQGTVTATGLWNGVTESRKACLRRGDSARERAGVPKKSKHRRQTTTQVSLEETARALSQHSLLLQTQFLCL